MYEASPLAGNDFPTNIYSAYSVDGINNWIKGSPKNSPVLSPLTNTFGYDQVANANLVTYQGENYLFHCTDKNSAQTGGIDVTLPSRRLINLF